MRFSNKLGILLIQREKIKKKRSGLRVLESSEESSLETLGMPFDNILEDLGKIFIKFAEMLINFDYRGVFLFIYLIYIYI